MTRRRLFRARRSTTAGRFWIVMSCLAVLGLSGFASRPAASTSHPLDPTVRTLPNGLEVAVFHDPRLPVLQVQLMVGAGSVRESEHHLGTAALTAQMLTRGSTSRSGAAYHEALAGIGGSLILLAAREYTTVGGLFLARDLESAIELMADAVLHPTFPAAEFQAIQSQAAAMFAQGRTATLAEDHVWASLFPDHPYGRPTRGVWETVLGIDREVVAQFFRESYRPDRALLAIAGDIEPDRAFEAVESYFGSWGGKSREVGLPEIPLPAAGRRIRVVDRPGGSVAEIRVAFRTPARAEPAFAALQLAVRALGDPSAPGRLATRTPVVRIASATAVGQRKAGALWAELTCPVDSVGSAASELLASFRDVAQRPPSEAELSALRRAHGNAQKRSQDAGGGLVSQWLAGEFFGLSQRAGGKDPIESVDVGSFQQAASQWLDPEKAVLVVVGPADKVRAKLESLGAVEVVPMEASPVAVRPSPSEDATPPTPEQLQKGRQLIDQAMAAHGGADRLRGIRNSSIEGSVFISTAGGELSGRVLHLRKEPQRFATIARLSQFITLRVLDDARGWATTVSEGDSVREVDSLDVMALREEFGSDLPHALLATAEKDQRLAWRGQEAVEGGSADVVEMVSPKGRRLVLFLDAGSHRLLAVEENQGFPSTQAVRRVYGDFRPVSGIIWPFVEERKVNGQRIMSYTFSKVSLNVSLEDELFGRPSPRTVASMLRNLPP